MLVQFMNASSASASPGAWHCRKLICCAQNYLTMSTYRVALEAKCAYEFTKRCCEVVLVHDHMGAAFDGWPRWPIEHEDRHEWKRSQACEAVEQNL